MPAPVLVEAKRLARESAWWRLAGLLFERPRAGWREEVAALAGEVEDPELRGAAADSGESDEGAYLAWLGPGGTISPREVAYRSFEDPARVLAELAGLYDSVAYRPRVEDPLDHLGVETGFVGYLLLKEALAEARGDAQAAETTRGARQWFAGNRLQPFSERFAERAGAEGAGHLSRTARAVARRARAMSREINERT